MSEIIIPNKDDKSKYRRELRSALRDIIINDYGITKEEVRSMIYQYTEELVEKEYGKAISKLTNTFIDKKIEEMLKKKLIEEGLDKMSHEFRRAFSGLSNEIRNSLFKAFNINDK